VWHDVVCFLVISPGDVKIRVSSSAILLQYLVNEQLVLGASCILSASFLLYWQQVLFVQALIMLSAMIPVNILNVVGKRAIGLYCQLLLPLLRPSWPSWFCLITSSLEHYRYP